MYKAYAGKVLGGRPKLSEDVTLPENAELVIMVLNESTPELTQPSRTQTQPENHEEDHTAIRAFMAAIDALEYKDLTEYGLTEEDFAELENNRANFHREVNL